MAIAYGLVAMTIVEFIANFAATRRYTSLSWWRMAKTLLPSMLLTAIMYICVKAVGCYAATLSPALLLLLQIGVGVALYIIGAWVCRLEAFNECIKIIKGVLKR
jgi:hypothetical protein